MSWTVPANTYPYGYRKDGNGTEGMGTMLTIAQYETRQTCYKLHPEFWRRFSALMQYGLTEGVHLGIGTGWRVQPNPPPPGFAAPGNSNHEGFPADGVTGGAVAIDAVPTPSFKWMEANLAAYGLRSFRQPSTTGYKGTDEPWHVQPAEIPASRMRRVEPWKLEEFPLPGTTKPPQPQPEPPPDKPPSEEDEVTDEDIAKIVKAVWAQQTSIPEGGTKAIQWVIGQDYAMTLRAMRAAEQAAKNTAP